MAPPFAFAMQLGFAMLPTTGGNIIVIVTTHPSATV
jgi:hypothetical protein